MTKISKDVAMMLADVFDGCTDQDGYWNGADVCDAIAEIIENADGWKRCPVHGQYSAWNATCPLCPKDVTLRHYGCPQCDDGHALYERSMESRDVSFLLAQRESGSHTSTLYQGQGYVYVPDSFDPVVVTVGCTACGWKVSRPLDEAEADDAWVQGQLKIVEVESYQTQPLPVVVEDEEMEMDQ
jgi:hypothetical protein